jgi:hypothetical protein
MLVGDETQRVRDAIAGGKALTHEASPTGYKPSSVPKKMPRATQRAIRKAEKNAAARPNVVFVSPRKQERKAEDTSSEDELPPADHHCCQKFGCSDRYKCTAEDFQGVLDVAYFRDSFKALSTEQQGWFISERVKVVGGKNQTYLESLDSMQGYRARGEPVPTRLPVLLTENDKCCRDYFNWVLGISRDRIDQPGSPGRFFNPEAARSGRLRANATRPAKVWNMVVQWLLLIATFYLHDPTKPHIYLPFAHRKAVYDLFETENHIDEEDHICHPSYFNYIWANDPGICHIRLRKHLRFALCPLCVKFMSARYHTMAEVDRTKLKAAEFLHSRFVRAERQSYYNRRRMACLYKKEYFSVIIDGADQAAYSMPHFAMLDKDTSQAMRIRNHLFGAIVHGRALYGFSYLDNCKHGTNLTIQALHLVLLKEWIRGGKERLPRVLFLQLDNCSKQNKSQYLIAYLGLLVGWDVFEEVILSFLPVGHTHEDIDQLFSRIAIFLRKNDARARQEFHEAFCTSCSSKKWGDDVIPEAVLSQAESMPCAANFSDLVVEQELTEKDATRKKQSANRVGLSDFHQFKLYKDPDTGKVSMLISEWCAKPVWRSNIERDNKPAQTDSGTPLPHVVFKDGKTPVVDVLRLMPAMQRKDTSGNWRKNKRTGVHYNIVDQKQRKGVESVIRDRNVPDSLAADLHECLDLLEDTSEEAVLWDTEMYEAHVRLGPRREHICDPPEEAPVSEEPDLHLGCERSDSEEEDDRRFLAPDDEGYAPATDQFTAGEVWLVPEIERDPERLGWGLCQVKGDPKLSPIEDTEFCGDEGEILSGNFWVVPVMWLMPSQTPKGKEDIAQDIFVRNQRKHTTSEKGWDTIFARSMLTALRVAKAGAGFKIQEADKALIRDTHEKAQENAPLQLSEPASRGKVPPEGRKKSTQKKGTRPPKAKQPRSTPPPASEGVGSRRTSRGGNKPAFDASRRQEIYDNLMSEQGLTWEKAWDASLALAVAEHYESH